MRREIKQYAIGFILILVTEIAIAVFGFHRWVRGFLGDLLVIPLLYLGFRLLFPISMKRAVLMVWCIALVIECLQAVEFTKFLGTDNALVRILLGQTFDCWDLLAYTLGAIAILLASRITTSLNKKE